MEPNDLLQKQGRFHGDATQKGRYFALLRVGAVGFKGLNNTLYTGLQINLLFLTCLCYCVVSIKAAT